MARVSRCHPDARHGGARVGRRMVPIELHARVCRRATRDLRGAHGDECARYATLRRMRAAPADPAQTASTIYLICAVAWFLPGAGHYWLGRRQKAIVFLVALTSMFAFGLWLEGRLFPFDVTQPLVALMAFADVGVGLPYFIARTMGVGAGNVVAITYEYGNTFIIAAGLLNMLVVLDVF